MSYQIKFLYQREPVEVTWKHCHMFIVCVCVCEFFSVGWNLWYAEYKSALGTLVYEREGFICPTYYWNPYYYRDFSLTENFYVRSEMEWGQCWQVGTSRKGLTEFAPDCLTPVCYTHSLAFNAKWLLTFNAKWLLILLFELKEIKTSKNEMKLYPLMVKLFSILWGEKLSSDTHKNPLLPTFIGKKYWQDHKQKHNFTQKYSYEIILETFLYS